MRTPSTGDRRDWIAGAFADRQDGVVGRDQLIGAGVHASAITRAIDAGRLRPIFAGVYAVGHRALSERGWMRAALLACGPEAILCDETAGKLVSLRPQAPLHPLHVIVPSNQARKQDGIVAHRCRVTHEERGHFEGLAVTSPSRTIVDLASHVRGRELRGLIERAQDLSVFDPQAIRHSLSIRKCKGAGPLRNLVSVMVPDEDEAWTYLERLGLRIVRAHELEKPLVNHPVLGRRRDLVWPRIRLVVELDSQRWHASPERRRIDALRDRELTAAGWRTARFTYLEIALEPDRFAADLRRLGVPRRS